MSFSYDKKHTSLNKTYKLDIIIQLTEVHIKLQ